EFLFGFFVGDGGDDDDVFALAPVDGGGHAVASVSWGESMTRRISSKLRAGDASSRRGSPPSGRGRRRSGSSALAPGSPGCPRTISRARPPDRWRVRSPSPRVDQTPA